MLQGLVAVPSMTKTEDIILARNDLGLIARTVLQNYAEPQMVPSILDI